MKEKTPVYVDGVEVADVILELSATIDPSQQFIRKPYPPRDLQFLTAVSEFKYILSRSNGKSKDNFKSIISMARHMVMEYLPNEVEGSHITLIPDLLKRQSSQYVKRLKKNNMEDNVFDNACDTLYRILYSMPPPAFSQEALSILKQSFHDFIGKQSRNEILQLVFMHTIEDQKLSPMLMDLVLKVILEAVESIGNLPVLAASLHKAVVQLLKAQFPIKRFADFLGMFVESAQFMCNEEGRAVWTCFRKTVLFLLDNRLSVIQNPHHMLMLKKYVPIYMEHQDAPLSVSERTFLYEIFEIISELTLESDFDLLTHEFPSEFLKFHTAVKRYRQEAASSSKSQTKALAESIFNEFFTLNRTELEFPYLLKSSMLDELESAKSIETTFFDESLDFVMVLICSMSFPRIKQSAVEELEISWEKILWEDPKNVAREVIFLMLEENPHVAHIVKQKTLQVVEEEIAFAVEGILDRLDRFSELVNFSKALDDSVFGDMTFVVTFIHAMEDLLVQNIEDLRKETMNSWSHLLKFVSAVILRSKTVDIGSTDIIKMTSLERFMQIDSKVYILEDYSIEHDYHMHNLAFLQTVNAFNDSLGTVETMSMVLNDYVSRDAKFPIDPDFVRESIQIDLWKSKTALTKYDPSKIESIMRKGIHRIYQTMSGLKPARFGVEIRQIFWSAWLQFMSFPEYKTFGAEIVKKAQHKFTSQMEKLKSVDHDTDLGDQISTAINEIVLGIGNIEVFTDTVLELSKVLKYCGFPASVFSEISEIALRLIGEILLKHCGYLNDREAWAEKVALMTKWKEVLRVIELIAEFAWMNSEWLDKITMKQSDVKSKRMLSLSGSWKRLSLRMSSPIVNAKHGEVEGCVIL